MCGLAAGLVGGREGCGHGIDGIGVTPGAVVVEQAMAFEQAVVVEQFDGVEPPSAGRIGLLGPGQRVAASSGVEVGPPAGTLLRLSRRAGRGGPNGILTAPAGPLLPEKPT